MESEKAKETPLRAGLTFDDVCEALRESLDGRAKSAPDLDYIIDLGKLEKKLTAPEKMPKFNVSVSIEFPVRAKTSEDAAKIALHELEYCIAQSRTDIIEGAKISVKEADK